MVFFGYQMGTKPPFVQYGVVSAEGELVHSFDPAVPHPTMMHDFAITEKYSILMDLPLRFDPSNLFTKGKAMLSFNNAVPSRFGIFPRHCSKSSDVKWFTASTCYVFHTANAWEHGGKVGPLLFAWILGVLEHLPALNMNSLVIFVILL